MKPSEALREAIRRELPRTQHALYYNGAYCALGAIAAVLGKSDAFLSRGGDSGDYEDLGVDCPSDIRDLIWRDNDHGVSWEDIADRLESEGF